MSLEERLKEFQAETRAALAEIRYDVLALRNDVSGIRTEMATKAEVESVRDDIRMLAEGYSQTQQRLHETSGLLRRFLTDTHSA